MPTHQEMQDAADMNSGGWCSGGRTKPSKKVPNNSPAHRAARAFRATLDLSDRTKKHLLAAQQQLTEIAARDHAAFRKIRDAIRQQYSRGCE